MPSCLLVVDTYARGPLFDGAIWAELEAAYKKLMSTDSSLILINSSGQDSNYFRKELKNRAAGQKIISTHHGEWATAMRDTDWKLIKETVNSDGSLMSELQQSLADVLAIRQELDDKTPEKTGFYKVSKLLFQLIEQMAQAGKLVEARQLLSAWASMDSTLAAFNEALSDKAFAVALPVTKGKPLMPFRIILASALAAQVEETKASLPVRAVAATISVATETSALVVARYAGVTSCREEIRQPLLNGAGGPSYGATC